MNRDMIIILDLGGGHSQSVARKVRGGKVYCEVLPYDTPAETLSIKKPKGLILVGGIDDNELPRHTAIYNFGVPVLAIGSAARIMVRQMGGRPLGAVIEKHTLEVSFGQSPLFNGLTASERYINRMDAIELPEGFHAIAMGGGLAAAFADEERKLYAMQFAAEQNDPDGLKILSNFACIICECDPWWSMDIFARMQIEAIRERVGGGSAIMAISGGVDSSVCAALMHRAIGRRMHCLYVDTGFMRKDETALIKKAFDTQMGLDLIIIDARERYLDKLKGIIDPEAKRKIVGEEFVRVFEEEAAKIGDVEYLVQGTIYSDVIESIGVEGQMIKSHHNVGGLPGNIRFKSIIEPLRELFKDEVRQVGEVLEMPREIIYRQPFPGPGLSVRCLGEVTEEKLNILREADAIFREEIALAGLDKRIWQYFCVLTDIHSTGIRNSNRTYEHVIALRAVNSIDAMTASAYRMPYDLLERVSNRIANEVPGAGRVVYDITGKPPGTIEWE